MYFCELIGRKLLFNAKTPYSINKFTNHPSFSLKSDLQSLSPSCSHEPNVIFQFFQIKTSRFLRRVPQRLADQGHRHIATKASDAQLWRTTYDVNGFGNRKVCPIRFSRALCRAKLRLYLKWSGFPGGRIGNKYDDPVARCRSAYFRINCNILLVISNRIIRPVL